MSFFQKCVSYNDSLEALATGLRSMEAGQFSAPADDPGGQVGSLLSAANLAEAGATEQQKKARVYAAVHSHYQNISVEATRRQQEIEAAKEKARTTMVQLYNSHGARFDEAKKDFEKIRQESDRGRVLAETKARELGLSATQISQLAAQSRDQVSGLFNGTGASTVTAPPPAAPAPGTQHYVAAPPAPGTTTTSQGISSNTMMALGGAALIAAGTVGGMAYFGNQAIDKADKKAQERIAQAEQTANRVIANAETTYNRMMDRARNEAALFRKELVADFASQMQLLSDDQLK